MGFGEPGVERLGDHGTDALGKFQLRLAVARGFFKFTQRTVALREVARRLFANVADAERVNHRSKRALF